jgi:hypothetical protein
MRKLLILIFILPLMAWGQSTLPPCPESGIKHSCWGYFTGVGWKYVGEFMNGSANGEGIRYRSNGDIAESGLWKADWIIRSYAVDTNRFPFNPPSRTAGASVPQQFAVQSSLPPCPETGLKHNCFGTLAFSSGDKYVGEFQNGKRDGQGIQYQYDSLVAFSGIWRFDRLTLSYPLNPRDFPFNASTQKVDEAAQKLANIFKSQSIGSLNWKDRLDRVVQSELRSWLAPQNSGLDEIPTPSYPAALSLKQEPWETNKEFEDRVEKARTERRLAIERLQAEYRSKVEERNKRVAEFNRTRTEREAQLPQKRRELVLLGISILNPSVAIADPALDQQSGALTVSAQVDGLGKQTFAFKDTPQAFRKSALTEPKAMKAKPEFQVSDAGEITLQAITVEAGGASVRGIPSAGITTQVQLATVNLPQASAPAIVQQSAISVDRNQVEQILYREENELLRKRLEEQRKQQEQAVANAEAKAAAEIARIREEAKRTQPESRPVLNYAAVKDAHALVIGNSAYPGSNRLANPVNDAKAMSAKLRSLGFKVTELANTNREQMVRGLSEFSKTASRADLTLLFYAGHGVQISGTNYMIPVDMSLTDASQATLQAVSLNSVVEQYLPGTTKLVFLDACRDNPLMATVGRGITKGLAPINVSQGTLIAYATKDGQTAEDGVGKVNSPFTAALLEHLSDPEDIGIILRTVRAKVMAQTQNRQQPWEYGSLTGGALVLSAIKR